MSRFLVAENGTRAPYWPTSPNSFGGQINASYNGDLPGDIYRLIGGVVLHKQGQSPAYAGYLSSAFLLPKGTNNNRVIAAGSEEVTGSDGSKARLFLVGLRPGMMYEVGTQFAPAVQIDPILPATITFTLTYPDGRQVIAQGTGDQFGTFAGKDKWTLDIPGVYRYWLEADWQGYKGYMPGLPREGGEMYVMESQKPANVPALKINLPEQSRFSASGTLTITGMSTASTVHYAAVIPGAVLGQGDITVLNGTWEYTLDPSEMARKFPTYDIINLVNGKMEISDVIHLTFFSKEVGKDGSTCHSFRRLIIRGTSVINAE
jgi:hypothetical protein